MCSSGEVRKPGVPAWLAGGPSLPSAGTRRALLAAWWKSATSVRRLFISFNKLVWAGLWKNLLPIQPSTGNLKKYTHRSQQDQYNVFFPCDTTSQLASQFTTAGIYCIKLIHNTSIKLAVVRLQQDCIHERSFLKDKMRCRFKILSPPRVQNRLKIVCSWKTCNLVENRSFEELTFMFQGSWGSKRVS